MGCMADYSEEDLKLMESVREEMLDEFKEVIDEEYRKEELNNLRAEIYRLGTCKSSKYKSEKIKRIMELIHNIKKEREELKQKLKGD